MVANYPTSTSNNLDRLEFMCERIRELLEKVHYHLGMIDWDTYSMFLRRIQDWEHICENCKYQYNTAIGNNYEPAAQTLLEAADIYAKLRALAAAYDEAYWND